VTCEHEHDLLGTPAHQQIQDASDQTPADIPGREIHLVVVMKAGVWFRQAIGAEAVQ